jgi:hypothetical protein
LQMQKHQSTLEQQKISTSLCTFRRPLLAMAFDTYKMIDRDHGKPKEQLIETCTF